MTAGTEALQGGLVKPRSEDSEAAEQERLSDQPEATIQAASSSQPGNSELTIEVELSGDGELSCLPKLSICKTGSRCDGGRHMQADMMTDKMLI